MMEVCLSLLLPVLYFCRPHSTVAGRNSRDCPIFYMRKKVQQDLQDQDKLVERFGLAADWQKQLLFCNTELHRQWNWCVILYVYVLVGAFGFLHKHQQLTFVHTTPGSSACTDYSRRSIYCHCHICSHTVVILTYLSSSYKVGSQWILILCIQLDCGSNVYAVYARCVWFIITVSSHVQLHSLREWRLEKENDDPALKLVAYALTQSFSHASH